MVTDASRGGTRRAALKGIELLNRCTWRRDALLTAAACASVDRATSTPHMDRLSGPQGIGQAGSDKVDTAEADEVIDAIAKTVAELTSQQDGVIRQQVIKQLMRQITHYDAEFRREEATSAVGSHAKH